MFVRDLSAAQPTQWLSLLLLFLLFPAFVSAASAPTKGLQVLDIAEHSHDGGGALAVVFSTPLDPTKNHDRFLNVTRKDGKLVDGGWVLSKSKRILLFPHVDPKTKYKVTVYQGLTAKNGSQLSRTTSKSITTRNITKSITFQGSGSLLPAKLTAGLPIVSINVDKIDVNFHRVSPDNYKDFFKLAHRRNIREFWTLERLGKVADLVYTARYDIDPPANKRRDFTIPLNKIKVLKKPGIYVAVMQAAGKYDTDLMDTSYFTITDIGMHARFYGDRLDVHLASLNSGKPLSKVKVQLLGKDGELLSEAKSTPGGLVVFTGMESKKFEQARFISARQGNYFTVLDLVRPALDLSDFNIGKRPYRPTELFLYGPRDLYRPGESVIISGLLRDQDGGNTHTPPLKARFRRPDGKVAREFTWQPGDGGYYEIDYPVSKNAPTGSWRLEADLPGSKRAEYKFKVEEFLPERMKLQFHDGNENKLRIYPADKNLQIPVIGEYLYGAPASGNRLESTVKVQRFREPLPQWKGFQFGDLKENDPKRRIYLDDVNLDEAGQAVLEIESRWKKVKSPLEILVSSSLYESGGRPVTRSASHLVWPGDAQIGIRAGFGDKNPEENSKLDFEVIMAHSDGSLVGGKKLEAQLITEDRQYFWEWSPGEGWHYEYSESEFVVGGASLVSSADGSARINLPVEYGHYRLEVSDPDTGARSSIRFHAGRDWYYWWTRSQVKKHQASRPDAVTLSFDKPAYEPGDTAVLTIVPPANGEAVVLVESDQPLWSKRLRVNKKGTKIRIPVGKNWNRHDIYASAVVFRPANKRAQIAPHRAFGLAHLKLNREQRKLAVKIEAPDKTRPNQEVPIKVALDNLPANSKARLTLAAVDVGVLSITRFETPDPFEGFYGQRRYGIDGRDVYDKVITPGKGALAKLRFGGDDEMASAGGEKPDTDIKIVSLFSGVVNADDKGEATIPLDLPDFNGRLRLMAIAFSNGNFGSNEQEMTVAAPLVTQLSTPRFMAPGDKATLALDVHNLSGQKQTIKVSLSADGPINIGDQPDELTLADGEKRTLRFQAEATGYSGKSNIVLDIANALDEHGQPMPIQRSWGLGVRPPWPAVTRKQSQMLKQDETLTLSNDLVNGLIPETGRIQLSAATQPILNIKDQLDRLLQYPYGCLEQTSSRVYPLLFANRANLAAVDLEVPFGEKERLKRINKGLDRIFSMQKPSGGYGLWSNHDADEHWLTAYVGDMLLDAREQGILIPERRLSDTLRRLGQNLRRNGKLSEQRYSSEPDHYAFAAKSYAGYVLSRIRKAPLGSLRNLYEKEAKHSKTGLPLIQLGIALSNMGDRTRGREAINKGLDMVIDKRGYYGDYGSRLRDTALTTQLLLKHQILTERGVEKSFKLAKLLHERRYLSTQERNSLFLAGLTLKRLGQKPWQAELRLQDSIEVMDKQGPWSRTLNGALQVENDGIALTSKHAEALFASALVRGYTKEAPQPTEGTLSIVRRYYNLEGQEVSDLKSVKEGHLLIARLEVSTKQRSPDALVVDLLPAGFELENPNLPDSVVIDDLEIAGKTIKKWKNENHVQHEEFRDDRYVAALDLHKYSPAHLFYVVRAVTPGSYKMPPPFVEDMYSPETFGIGEQPVPGLVVTGKK